MLGNIVCVRFLKYFGGLFYGFFVSVVCLLCEVFVDVYDCWFFWVNWFGLVYYDCFLVDYVYLLDDFIE